MNSVISFSQSSFLSPAFVKLFWLWIALGSINIFEPAPYDILFVICFAAAVFLSIFTLPRYAVFPVLLISWFINANLISMILMTGDIEKASLFFLITFYLVGSWFLLIGVLQHHYRVLLHVFFSGYVFAALVAVIIGLLAYFRLIPYGELFLYYDRVAGTFDDANVFGPFLIPAVLYAVYKFEKKGSLTWLIMAIFLSIGVLLSFSRGAWGNYLISFFIYIFISPGKTIKEKLYIIVIISILIPIILFTISQSIVGDLLIQRVGYQSYDNHRFGTQLASLKLALDHPFGIGPRQTESLLNMSTHSLYIRVITEYGIMGIFSFIAFLFLTLGRSLCHCIIKNNSFPYSAIVTASLAGIMFNSFFIDTLHWRHFWILLALPWIPLKGGFDDENSSSGNKIRQYWRIPNSRQRSVN